ncbi:MAG: glycoside hydrolase family 5 protein [Treponemataceae bacterium]|nr:glycoside hydrolase family 5 protein [Treponemataceae bacterium]
MKLKNWAGYQRGVNLGGWLSQCCHEKNHYETFICEENIKQIKSWGIDHVRLPIDYNLLQNADGEFIEANFCYIDNCAEWCKNAGLNLILDLHKTAGYSFDTGENENGFFGNPKYEKMFIDLWCEFARRYGKLGDRVAFELLNEITDPGYNPDWQRISAQTIKAIRGICPTVKILIGGYWNNSAAAVKDLILPPDENIIYNFHCYSPLCFTHQGAYWVEAMPADFRLDYPFSFDDPKAAGAKKAYEIMKMEWPKGATGLDAIDREIFEAVKVAQERGVMLYCGEYGVIDLAKPESTLGWFKEINSVFEKYGIGRACWNYKEKDFGISGAHYDSIRSELLKYL